MPSPSLAGLQLPAAPLLTPQWAVGLWRAETIPGSSLPPGLSLAYCGAQVMPWTKPRRSEFCSLPGSAQMRFDQKHRYPTHFTDKTRA